MRRILLTAVGITALALATPGAALAHHAHHHKRHHHGARAGARHNAQVSFRHLGPSSGTGASGSTTKPTTTPTTTEENAGTVASYSGGVLTVKLNNGSTVSGNVTVNTSFKCISATTTPTPSTNPGPSDSGWGGDQGQSGSQQDGSWRDDWQGSGGGGQWQGGGDDHGWGGGEEHNEAPISTEPPCDSSALTEGTTVRAAELRIAPGGAEFEWITLVK